MKLNPDGSIEGTPEELAELIRLKDLSRVQSVPIPPVPYTSATLSPLTVDDSAVAPLTVSDRYAPPRFGCYIQTNKEAEPEEAIHTKACHNGSAKCGLLGNPLMCVKDGCGELRRPDGTRCESHKLRL